MNRIDRHSAIWYLRHFLNKQAQKTKDKQQKTRLVQTVTVSQHPTNNCDTNTEKYKYMLNHKFEILREHGPVRSWASAKLVQEFLCVHQPL
jgi:hypothetical protein